MALFILAGGVVLLAFSWNLHMRMRDKRMAEIIVKTDDPAVATELLDEAIEEDKANTEFWRSQNPGGF